MIEPLIRQIFSRLPKRTQEVLWRRFGLKNNQPETLEAIGRDFGITRERVRQIEESGFKIINKNLPDTYNDFVRLVASHLENFAGAREEKRLLGEIRFATSDRHPASASRIKFLLSLSDKFTYFEETPRYSAFWSLGREAGQVVLKFVDGAMREIKKNKKPIPIAEVESFATHVAKANGMKNVSAGMLLSHLVVSKELAANPFGHFGFTGWAQIIPRSVRDRAYLVLHKAQRPIHFKELAKLINEQAKTANNFHPAWQKPVEVQTVHNELIKDENFVLVGRGIYALKEWGYRTGTVRDLITSILRFSPKPLAKEELIEAVKAQRLVQDNTILINLQNRRFFERLPDGRYRVRGHRHVVKEA